MPRVVIPPPPKESARRQLGICRREVLAISRFGSHVPFSVSRNLERSVCGPTMRGPNRGREGAVRVAGKIAVVTGGAAGIGKSLLVNDFTPKAPARRLWPTGRWRAHVLARTISGEATDCDVADESQIISFVDTVERSHGPIDLFRWNAGIATLDTERGDAASALNAAWTRSREVNAMANVYAARALVSRMAARGGGYFLNTASAAGCCRKLTAPFIPPPNTRRSALPSRSRSPIATRALASRSYARKASIRRCRGPCRAVHRCVMAC